MKRTLLAIFSSVILATPAFALVGGPFDNNIFFGNNMASTYQGVITGKNVSGIMVFGTASGSATGQGSASEMGTFGSAGRGLVFINGNMVACDVTAVGDFGGRKLSIALSGSVGFGATDTAQVTKVITNSTTTEKEDTNTGIITRETKDVDTTVITTYTLEGASQISGMIDARFTRTFPNIEYSGKGELVVIRSTRLVQFGNNAPTVANDTEEIDVRVNGVRTANSSPTILGTLTWHFPSVTTSTTTVVATP